MSRVYVTRDAYQQALTTGAAQDDVILLKQYIAEVAAGEPEKPTTRRFVVSTGAVDRDNDTVAVTGWHLDNFRRNPVVLWAHDYASLPIARCTDITLEDGKLVATAQFADHALAQTCLNLVDGGFLNATSVGFRPMKSALNEERRGVDFIEQELLEFSLVPVPANPEALILRAAAADVEQLRTWATKVLSDLKAPRRPPPVAPDEDEPLADDEEDVEAPPAKPPKASKGVSPTDVSRMKAPADEAWSAPTLSDLTDKAWADLTDAETRRIAGHFAYAASMPPESFGDLSLPHHNAKGEVVWRGVAAAAGRLGQAKIPVADLAAVKAHLRRHYAQFDQEPPDSLKAASAEEPMADAIVAKVLAGLAERMVAAPVCASCGTPDARLMVHERDAAAVCLSCFEKRGRVLSAANESKIRQAKTHVAQALEHMDAVLAALPPVQPDDEESDPDAKAVLDLDEPDDGLDVDPDDLRVALAAAVRESVGEMVTRELQTALAKARGRVD